MSADAHFRIGELSRRTGFAPELLRAWERRYGLLRPDRTSGGFRLYSDDDLERILLMRRHLEDGLSAAEAAALASIAELTSPGDAGDALAAALDGFDDARANVELDRLLATFSAEAVIRDVLMPYLSRLGERWAEGEGSIAQEHFASSLLRGRLLGLARGWDRGMGPRVVLACPPGEQHDLPLIALGLALRARGWRVTYLGADTPLDDLAAAVRALDPRLVVLSAVIPGRFEAVAAEIAELAAIAPVALAGPAATRAAADSALARYLDGDPAAAADELTRDAA